MGDLEKIIRDIADREAKKKRVRAKLEARKRFYIFKECSNDSKNNNGTTAE